MSRPRITFNERDIDQVEQLAKCQCTDEEICAFLRISETTLKRRLGPILKSAREAGRAGLRAKQYKLAMEGNSTLLIWLGKQILRQSDKMHFDIGSVPEDVFSAEVERRLASAAKK